MVDDKNFDQDQLAEMLQRLGGEPEAVGGDAGGRRYPAGAITPGGGVVEFERSGGLLAVYPMCVNFKTKSKGSNNQGSMSRGLGCH